MAARVQHCTKSCVFCQVGFRKARMPIHRCRISRLRHCEEVFQPGQTLYAAVLGQDPLNGQLILSGREVLGTWEENAQRLRQGQMALGTVRTVASYGIFIELRPNLCGLAEYRPGLNPGSAVAVAIRAIVPKKHKVKLDIRQALPDPLPRKTPEYFITSGHIRRWEYFPGSKAVTVF